MKLCNTIIRIFLLLVTAASIPGRAVSADVLATEEPAVGYVLIGPCGAAGAEGPTGVNDDFTNRNIELQARNANPTDVSKMSATVVFQNTIQNLGTRDDIFEITVPLAPPGFKIELSTDFGATYTPLDGPNRSVAVAVAYRAANTLFVRITTPAGLSLLSPFESVIRATSTTTPTASNETINRIYTGFIRLETAFRILNAIGTPDLAHVTPGTEIEFAVTYTNISTAQGAGSSLLTAHNLVISENGNSAPNNWGTTTEHIIGASDTRGGYIIGDREGSTSLTDIVMSLDAGKSGVFKFRRRVK